ncbi:uncharacterized protein DUF955 [Hydrogenispora ethanolica]|uniref:Uncharacterized protein DUF955 n=1 Tax=Hydrogenispora ethanolica TaxID=1082276 RepID=A0A4R1SCX3_HYDET|nr:ImmA/IrrE family metallo-endopeptidase [Hydrogenispora ethanolica]TCL76880.1 uncharacterized protein DUF955 [Hydrogenispora ethanolica]
MNVREDRARQTARRVQEKLPKFLPVDVLAVCEACGYILRFHDDALDDNEEAVTYYLRDRYLIFLKKTGGRTASCRLRWTIAHELGHILLGHFEEYDLSFSAASKLGRQVAWVINREANLFAEELLMPEAFLRGHMEEGSDALRRICDVSRQSLAIRLKRLGLAEPDPAEPDLAEPTRPSRTLQAAETAAVYLPGLSGIPR